MPRGTQQCLILGVLGWGLSPLGNFHLQYRITEVDAREIKILNERGKVIMKWSRPHLAWVTAASQMFSQVHFSSTHVINMCARVTLSCDGVWINCSGKVMDCYLGYRSERYTLSLEGTEREFLKWSWSITTLIFMGLTRPRNITNEIWAQEVLFRPPQLRMLLPRRSTLR